MSSYLHSKALDRKGDHIKTSLESGIKPDLILNLGIVWCLIFLCLYQGLHRAGRLIVLSAALPLLLFTITSFRFIESYGNGIDRILTFSDKPFFLDSLVRKGRGMSKRPKFFCPVNRVLLSKIIGYLLFLLRSSHGFWLPEKHFLFGQSSEQLH